MAERTCGGCEGKGSHRRWCEASVGRGASLLGRYSEQAESLADSVGANNTGAASYLYAAAGLLRKDAIARRDEFRATLTHNDDEEESDDHATGG